MYALKVFAAQVFHPESVIMRIHCFLPVCVALMCSLTSALADAECSNGYFYLHARDGWLDALRLDPSGESRYGPNIIRSLSIGPVYDDRQTARIEKSETSLVFRSLRIRVPMRTEHMSATHPIELRPGMTLGVKFTVDSGKLLGAGGKFPTWYATDAGFTLSLYRLPTGDLSNRKLISTKKFENIPDNSIQLVECDPEPPGVFYLEMSHPTGTRVGWWGSQGESRTLPACYMNGEEVRDTGLTLVYQGFDEITGDWTVTLDGPKLRSSFAPVDSDAEKLRHIDTLMVTPWEKDGYDISKSPFTRFYTDTGQHIIVQELKRRPFSDHLRPANWVYAMGQKGADLRIDFSPGQRLVWEFGDAEAIWKFSGTALDVDVLPHSPKLPDYYPVFYSSDARYDRILNEFYYSHALNFGVGTPADWKEWQALILDWTANPQRDEQRGHFTGMPIRSDGYVHCWGGQEGWPFPYKDDDKDGKNDFDTRHFTSNATYILGAYRYFVWTRDEEFLKEVMPRLRKAMAYQLNDLKGRSGIIIADAPGHEGRHDGIGSNYWDILPFGYKDAFSNTYYYASLQAMAELEQFCLDRKLDLPGPKESPSLYKALRLKARRVYNETFWDDTKGRYIGCVDVDGVRHDYGFTFVNLEAMAYGLADREQAKRIYRWMETEVTSSGKADTYSRWKFAPRATTIHNPPRDMPQTPAPSWWHFGWGGTPFGEQCQDGGAILYTSGYDIMARAKLLGADNAYQRLREILDRYNKPDRLCGGSPLYYGETTQGGPGGSPGSVGVEGEFPESGLAPASFLYAILGIDADVDGLKIRPNLPSALKYAGVRNLSYAGGMYDIKVTNDSVEIKMLDLSHPTVIKRRLKPGEVFTFRPPGRAVSQR